MHLANRNTRSAFSLLEMMIALVIGMLLLGALYAFMSTQFSLTQAGRETVEEGALVRAIFTRISNDIISQVGPYDQRMVNDPVAAAAAAAANASSSTSNSTTTTASPPPLPAVTYNIGVYGTPTMLQLSNYRVQTAPPGILTGNIDPNLEILSDLRRVTYFLAMNGAEPLGLGRREFRQATADDINNQDPTTYPDQLKLVIAKEVLSLTFEYYDGTTWQQEWDGTELASDEVTQIGPPVAIRITLTLRKNANRGLTPVDAVNDQGPTFQHVIAMPAVNFFNQVSSPSTP